MAGLSLWFPWWQSALTPPSQKVLAGNWQHTNQSPQHTWCVSKAGNGAVLKPKCAIMVWDKTLCSLRFTFNPSKKLHDNNSVTDMSDVTKFDLSMKISLRTMKRLISLCLTSSFVNKLNSLTMISMTMEFTRNFFVDFGATSCPRLPRTDLWRHKR